MNFSKVLLPLVAAIASYTATLPAQADTVTARCDVYPKGEDRAKSSGLCTFSQRQGVVGIQLQNGKRYDLAPVGNKPENYRDQNGRPAHRESGLGDKGQIYRLANESIFVYWDTAPYGKKTGSSPVSSQPKAGTAVDRLKDLVGAKAGQAENTLIKRGYEFVKPASSSGNSRYSYWRETKTNFCVSIVTEDGRYRSFVYGVPSDCK